MIRAFIAVNLAPVVVEEIAKVRAALQSAGGDVRWVRMEGVHLTLKFLGDIARPQVEPILAALHQALHQQPALLVRAQGLGAFPTLKRPRVVWVGLTGDGLKDLSDTINTALMPLDFPPEERDFTPHLTLGRVRSLRGWEQVLAVAKTYAQTDFGQCKVEEVTLYQSDLRPDGAVYRPLGSIPLRQSP